MIKQISIGTRGARSLAPKHRCLMTVGAACAILFAGGMHNRAGSDETTLASNPVSATVSWSERAYRRTLNPDLGLPPVPYPTDNPPTAGKIHLGRKLFFDRRLSINRTMSCAMCHVPEQGFTNWELKTAVGVEGRSVKRNSPTVINTAYYTRLFVDGRDPALETQYIAPLTARNEMANPSAGFVVETLQQLPDYAGLFEKNFGAPASLDHIGMALASYQRSLLAADSPFDRWRYGNSENTLSDAQKRGFVLFSGKAGCASCHLLDEKFALFTDNQFHDIGYGWWRESLRQNPPETSVVEVAPGVTYPVPNTLIASVGAPAEPDLGRYEVTENPNDRWMFRTPSLRNVAVTRPYMHDGGFATLMDVLEFYNAGGKPHSGQDRRIRPLGLGRADLNDLEAFLEALTSPNIDLLVKEARSEVPDNY